MIFPVNVASLPQACGPVESLQAGAASRCQPASPSSQLTDLIALCRRSSWGNGSAAGDRASPC